MTDIYTKFPVLEYQEHPAFSSIDPGKSINYNPILDRLKELEDQRKELQAPKSLWSFFSWKKADKDNSKLQYSNFIKNCYEELEIANKEILGTRNDWSTYEINAINKLIEHIKNEVVADARVLWWQTHEPQEIEINDRLARECLIDNGYAAFQLDPKSVSKLRSLVGSLETDLRNMDTRNPCMWACKLVEPTVYPEFMDYLQNCLKDLNVFAIAGITLDTQESRKLLLRLPSHFRNISHFGDDLLTGEELEKSYQYAEKKFTGDKGLTILFDNYGLHRGGMTKKGERVALQISLRAIDSYSLL